jgi:hypothetical protein
MLLPTINDDQLINWWKNMDEISIEYSIEFLQINQCPSIIFVGLDLGVCTMYSSPECGAQWLFEHNLQQDGLHLTCVADCKITN